MLRSEGHSERAIFIVDKAGIIRYVDVHNIDEQPDNNILFQELAEIEGVPVPQEIIPETSPSAVVTQPVSAGGNMVADAPGGPAVTMYCTDWCPACRRARAYFKVNNIPVIEINITRDRAAAARVREMTGGYETTPTFDVNGTVVVNFNVERLNELLGIKE